MSACECRRKQTPPLDLPHAGLGQLKEAVYTREREEREREEREKEKRETEREKERESSPESGPISAEVKGLPMHYARFPDSLHLTCLLTPPTRLSGFTQDMVVMQQD